MSIKPILFNTDMVRGLLADRKTATRRVVKPRFRDSVFEIFQGQLCEASPDKPPRDNGDGTKTHFVRAYVPCKAPYRPGDILYVRETWCKYGELDAAEHIIPETEKYYYRADGENPTPFNCFLVQHPGWDEYREVPVWHPSIHMPREAARIFLRVTDVRVERLQAMSHEDAEQEGCWCGEGGLAMPLDKFADVWDSTIKPADCAIYGWAANPWVWVIEFERVSREEAAMGNA